MARQVALTTSDNPFDPINDFDQWYAYDLSQGRDTVGYFARIAKLSDELPPAYYDAAKEDAIDEVLEINPLGIYEKFVYNGAE